jgi:hypothetical protein
VSDDMPEKSDPQASIELHMCKDSLYSAVSSNMVTVKSGYPEPVGGERAWPPSQRAALRMLGSIGCAWIFAASGVADDGRLTGGIGHTGHQIHSKYKYVWGLTVRRTTPVPLIGRLSTRLREIMQS